MADTNYSTNAIKIIDGALRAIGVLRSGDTSNNDLTIQNDCLEALNLMVKNFQNYGIEQWLRKTYTISNLTAYKSNYTIGFANTNDITTNTSANNSLSGIPERIVQAYVTPQANVDVECMVISMSEYWQLANKEATGTPNQVAYYFQNNQSKLYVWPVPSTNTYHLTFVYHKPYDDLDSNVDIPDFPQRWFEALKWNLAVRLAPEFGRPITPEMTYLAQSTLDNAIDMGYEEQSVYFTPDSRRSR